MEAKVLSRFHATLRWIGGLQLLTRVTRDFFEACDGIEPWAGCSTCAHALNKACFTKRFVFMCGRITERLDPHSLL